MSIKYPHKGSFLFVRVKTYKFPACKESYARTTLERRGVV